MSSGKYAKLLEEHENGWRCESPDMSSVDIALDEYLSPDLSYNYKLSVKINDDTFVIYFDKKTDAIMDYGLLSDDGSLIKIESKRSCSNGMRINGCRYSHNNPPYDVGTVFDYNGRYVIKLGIYDSKINALFNRGIGHPISVMFDLDIPNMEHMFNVAAGYGEVRPTCSFVYKKELIDIKVAKSIGLIFEHKFC